MQLCIMNSLNDAVVIVTCECP